MLSNLKAVGIFFKFSPKRQRSLEQCVELENEHRSVADEELIRAKKLCDMRWVERHTALADFLDMYHAVVHCLEVISGQSPHPATEEAVQKYE